MKYPRVAVYLRVSTTDQKTDLQRSEIERYLQARGWTAEYYEDKLSGTSGNRPELKHLLGDVRSRNVDLVICWKLDRLFRSLKDLVSTLQDFSELGVEFISLKDNIDLTTSSGRLMMHMIGAFAEFEASLIRERVKAGLELARANGKTLGRPVQIDAPEVKRLREQGLSLSQIAAKLSITKSGVSKTLKKLSVQVPEKQ